MSLFSKIISIIIAIGTIFALGVFSSPLATNAPAPQKTQSLPTEEPRRNETVSDSGGKIGVTSSAASTTPDRGETKKIESPAAKVSIPTPAVKPEIQEKLETLIKANPQVPPSSVMNDKLRAATINILCTSKFAGPFVPISGSGVMIDPRGVILTNAHIGQYLLLEKYRGSDFLECVIRTGSPAAPKYRAKLLYIPPRWVEANKSLVRGNDTKSTGEHDYALLRIYASTNPDEGLPASFPFVETSTSGDAFSEDRSGYLAVAYGAGFLGGIIIQKDLSLTSTTAGIEQFFTFKESTVDVFSLGANILAQKGASGGGVFSPEENALVGIIVTATTEDSTSKRDVRGITLAHINRSFSEFSGSSLKEFLSHDLDEEQYDFETIIAPALRETLISELEK